MGLNFIGVENRFISAELKRLGQARAGLLSMTVSLFFLSTIKSLKGLRV